MKSSHVRMLAALIFVLAVSLFPGCPFGPDDDKETPAVSEYKPLTDKENVVYNLVKSYNKANIEEYVKLLHDDYIWYNQAMDVQRGLEELYTRAEDIEMTTRMFQAKLGTHPDPSKHLFKLELKLYAGSWQSIGEFPVGTPCEDCWQTTREYYLTLVTKSGDVTYIANEIVKLTVVPVTIGDKKLYKLVRVDDIAKS